MPSRVKVIHALFHGLLDHPNLGFCFLPILAWEGQSVGISNPIRGQYAHTRYPMTTERLYILQERDPVPLTIHHLPVAVTFAFFEEGELVVSVFPLRAHTVSAHYLTPQNFDYYAQDTEMNIQSCDIYAQGIEI